MKKTVKALSNQEGQVRDLSQQDLQNFKPLKEVDVALFDDFHSGKINIKVIGRPKLDNSKVPVSIRLDSEVLDYFKSTGKGWQTKINDVLVQHIPHI